MLLIAVAIACCLGPGVAKPRAKLRFLWIGGNACFQQQLLEPYYNWSITADLCGFVEDSTLGGEGGGGGGR